MGVEGCSVDLMLAPSEKLVLDAAWRKMRPVFDGWWASDGAGKVKEDCHRNDVRDKAIIP